MIDLDLAGFAALLGEDFPIAAADLSLTLTRVDPIPNGPRPGGSFSLIFSGPPSAVLPQGTYDLAVRGDQHPVFIVPTRRTAEAVEYQAIFN